MSFLATSLIPIQWLSHVFSFTLNVDENVNKIDNNKDVKIHNNKDVKFFHKDLVDIVLKHD